MQPRGAQVRAAALRRRRWPRIIGGAFVLAILGAAIALHFLQPARLTRLILSRASSTLRVQLRTSGPGSYALRPEPRLVLPGLTATVPGDTAPFFRSNKIEFALPWNTLRGNGAEISSIVVKSPDLDLHGLQRWMATLPPSSAPLKLPHLTRGLRVYRGTLRGAGWTIDNLNLALPSLADGAPTVLDINGQLLRGTVSSRFLLRLQSTPSGIGQGLRVDAAQAILKADGELPSLTAEGSLIASDTTSIDLRGRLQNVPASWSTQIDSSFARSGDTPFSLFVSDAPPSKDPGIAVAEPRHGIRVHADFGDARRQPALTVDAQASSGAIVDASLKGRLSRWPDGLPGPPAAIAGNLLPILFEASYKGPIFVPEPLVFTIRRGDAVIQGKTRIRDLRAWMARDFGAPAPPVQATFDAPQIDIGGVQLRGVHAEVRDDPPAPVAPIAPAQVPKS